MSHRVVVDAGGVAWDVWEVHPTSVDKRNPDVPAEAPVTGERRRTRLARMHVAPEMRTGWLAMKSPTERRRVAPIPDGWAALTDAAILALIATAAPAGSPRRLIE
jgi:hypothetical protein